MKRYQLILAACLVSVLSNTPALAQLDQTTIKQIVEIDPSLGFGFNDQFSDLKKKFGAYITEADEGYFSFQTDGSEFEVTIYSMYDYPTESYTEGVGQIDFEYASLEESQVADRYLDFANYLKESVRYEEYEGYDFPNHFCEVTAELEKEESILTISMISKD